MCVNYNATVLDSGHFDVVVNSTDSFTSLVLYCIGIYPNMEMPYFGLFILPFYTFIRIETPTIVQESALFSLYASAANTIGFSSITAGQFGESSHPCVGSLGSFQFPGESKLRRPSGFNAPKEK